MQDPANLHFVIAIEEEKTTVHDGLLSVLIVIEKPDIFELLDAAPEVAVLGLDPNKHVAVVIELERQIHLFEHVFVHCQVLHVISKELSHFSVPLLGHFLLEHRLQVQTLDPVRTRLLSLVLEQTLDLNIDQMDLADLVRVPEQQVLPIRTYSDRHAVLLSYGFQVNEPF